MPKKKVSSIVILALLGGLMLAGCGKSEHLTGSKQGPVEIEVAFWGAPDEVMIIKDIIGEWQINNPGIKVRLEHTPYRGYTDKLLTRIAGRSAPDIICTEVELFVTFQSKGVLLDITPYVAADPDISIDDFYPTIIERFSPEGKLYALPRDTAPFACVYYNKDIFDAAGVSYPTDDWDVFDMLDKAKKLTKIDDNGRTVRYGFYAWAWQNFVYAFGGSIVDDVKHPKRCVLDEDRAIKGLTFYTDLINKYKVHPSSTAMSNLAMGVQGMFMTGRLAMFSSGIWETPGLRKNTGLNWDVVMFPKGPDGIRGFGTGGSGYCILKNTKHPDAAYKVLKALAGKDAQKKLAKTGLTQPAMMNIAKVWAEDNSVPKNKKMLLEAVQYVKYEPFTPVWREAKELYILPVLDKVFKGKEEPKGAVRSFIGNVDRLLSNER